MKNHKGVHSSSNTTAISPGNETQDKPNTFNIASVEEIKSLEADIVAFWTKGKCPVEGLIVCLSTFFYFIFLCFDF